MTFALLVPAYNAVSTLAETLASIALQQPDALHHILRIVVADDGSKDTTCELARSFASSSSLPIEVWQAECNRGERATVNHAFQKLRAEGCTWCFVLHADDVAKPQWLSSLLPLALKAEEQVVSLCSSWDDWYPPYRLVPGANDMSTEKVVIEGSQAAAAGTLNNGCWWHFSGCAMQLDPFFKVGSFHEGMPQLGDLEWLIRSELAGLDVWYVPRSLIQYRQTQSNVSAVSFRTNRDLREMVMIFDLLSQHLHLKPALRAFARRQSISAARRSLKSALTGKWERSVSASQLAAQLFARYCGYRKRVLPA